MTAAQIIATNLASLPHPDGAPRQLPGFAAQVLPAPLQEEMRKAANDVGEAIVNLLELNGYRIVTDDELDQPAESVEPPQVANVHCAMCDQKLFSINLTNPEHTLTNGRLFLEGLGALSPECPHR